MNNELEVNIDFDDSIREWRSNKKSLGNGQYKYICAEYSKKGNKCMRERINDCEYCSLHKKSNERKSFIKPTK